MPEKVHSGPSVGTAQKQAAPLQVEPQGEKAAGAGIAAMLGHAGGNPPPLEPAQVLWLQRTAGNRAVARAFPAPTGPGRRGLPIQAKPAAGATYDRYGPKALRPVPSLARDVRPNMLRRATLVVGAKTHSREITAPVKDSHDQKELREAIKGSTKKESFPKGAPVNVSDRQPVHITDDQGNVQWYRLGGKAHKLEFVRASKTFNPAETGKAAGPEEKEEPELAIKGVLEKASNVVDPLDVLLLDKFAQSSTEEEDITGQLEQGTRAPSEEVVGHLQQHSNIDIAEGVVWTAGGVLNTMQGIIGMAATLKKLHDNPKRTKEEIGQAIYDVAKQGVGVLGGLGSITGGVSQIISETTRDIQSEVYQGAETGNQIASGIGAWCFGFGEVFGAVTSLMEAVKNGIGQLKAWWERRKMGEVLTRSEKFEVAGGTLKSILDVLKGSLRSVKYINDALGDVASPGLAQVMDSAVPGASIAISAVNIAMQAYYTGKSAKNFFQMKARQRGLMQTFMLAAMGTGIADPKQKKAKEEEVQERIERKISGYAALEAQIATIDDLIEETKTKKAALDDPKKQPKAGSATAQSEQKKIAAKQKLDDKIKDLEAKKEEVKKEIAEMEERARKRATREFPGLEEPDVKKVALTRQNLAQVQLANELKYINRKRITRNIILISDEAAKIGGDVATLVAGPGSPAGLALKAAASMIPMGMTFTRWVKEQGRTAAAKKIAQGGKVSGPLSLFDPSKAGPAKIEQRKKEAIMVVNLVGGLNDYLPATTVADEKQKRYAVSRLKQQVDIVESYMRAAGLKPSTLYQANGDLTKQIKLLVTEMAKREL